MGRWATLGIAAGLMGTAFLSACSPDGGLKSSTPALLAAPQNCPMADSADPVHTPDDLDLLYVTDRAPTADPQTHALSYGSERSRTMSFGSIEIHVEPDLSGAVEGMKLGAITEIGRFPEVPYPAKLTSAGYRRAPDVVAAHEKAVALLQGEIRRRLAKAERKEVVVFIHGYNNTFNDAANATGSICRLLGPDFVCVALSWPAGGSRGAFMGYNVDREFGRVRGRRHAEGDPGHRPDRRSARSPYHRPQPRHGRAGVSFSAVERRGLCFALFDRRGLKGKEHCFVRAGYRH